MRISEAIGAATQKVIAEFNRFGESLLGKETYWQKASGRRAALRPDTDVIEVDAGQQARTPAIRRSSASAAGPRPGTRD